MKSLMKISILNLLVLLIGLQSCTNMDVFPTDQMTTGFIANSSDGILNVTNGNYSMFKDVLTFNGFKDDNNNYLRQYFQMSTFATDNIVNGQRTEDPLWFSFTYTHSPSQANARYFWYISYKIINGANTVIDILKDKKDKDAFTKQLEGENYFLRAFCTFNLVRFYAKPYNEGDPTTNPGVILRKSASESGVKARASVKESFDFAISDLKKAAALMNQSRGKSFASKEAAWAMLSRVYLNMGDYDNTIAYSDSVINSGKFTLETGASYPSYFANALNRPETIWAVAYTPADNRGKFGSIASMLYSDGNSGWGEEFASKSLRNVMSKHLNDVRWDYIDTSYTSSGTIAKKNGIQIFYITKFSFQDEDPNLASPVMFRLAEMYLNRAEAYANKGNENAALSDVNEIRKNRGLQNALYTSVPAGNTILDVVLEERRIEFAFEGPRLFDLLRNKRDIVRDYWGYHISGLTVSDVDLSQPPTGYDNLIIPWNSSKVQYFIPVDEILANSLCEQNP